MLVYCPKHPKAMKKKLYEQINGYFDTLLSNIQGGFRKGHSCQHSLLVMRGNA